MKNPRVSAVVAMDKNRGIGKTEMGVGKILWRIKDDLKRLSDLTRNQIIIIGRKTYDSMAWYYDRSGKDMPGKLYVVVTRDKNYEPSRKNAVVVNSIEEALERAKKENVEEIFNMGGAQMFEQLLPYTNRLYLTLVDKEYDADTFFPEYKNEFKKEISREDRETIKGLKYTWLTLERG